MRFPLFAQAIAGARPANPEIAFTAVSALDSSINEFKVFSPP